jgi:hypothetical protein
MVEYSTKVLDLLESKLTNQPNVSEKKFPPQPTNYLPFLEQSEFA